VQSGFIARLLARAWDARNERRQVGFIEGQQQRILINIKKMFVRG
jgi:hypothetical protein